MIIWPSYFHSLNLLMNWQTIISIGKYLCIKRRQRDKQAINSNYHFCKKKLNVMHIYMEKEQYVQTICIYSWKHRLMSKTSVNNNGLTSFWTVRPHYRAAWTMFNVMHIYAEHMLLIHTNTKVSTAATFT